jgi:hypothetical protein
VGLEEGPVGPEGRGRISGGLMRGRSVEGDAAFEGFSIFFIMNNRCRGGDSNSYDLAIAGT